MKTFLMVLLSVFLFAGGIMAQPVVFSGAVLAADQPVPSEGFGFNFAIGQDNAYLVSPGAKAGFFAVGGGVDLAGYTKCLSRKGSTLALYLHGTILTPVSGATKSPIFGMGINCDLLQLLTGTKVKILINELSLLAGPIAAYDVGMGRMAYGGLVNFNYKF